MNAVIKRNEGKRYQMKIYCSLLFLNWYLVTSKIKMVKSFHWKQTFSKKKTAIGTEPNTFWCWCHSNTCHMEPLDLAVLIVTKDHGTERWTAANTPHFGWDMCACILECFDSFGSTALRFGFGTCGGATLSYTIW